MKAKKPKKTSTTRGLALTDAIYKELCAEAIRRGWSVSLTAREALRLGLKAMENIAMLSVLMIFVACGSYQTVKLTTPANTPALDLANMQAAAASINEAFGCSVVTITPSDDAKPLADNVIAFAATPSDEDVLFAEGADGFEQRSNGAIYLISATLPFNGKPLPDDYARRQIMHEIGHALGISWHSTTAGAIMNTKTVNDAVSDAMPEYISTLKEVGVACPSVRK